VIFKQQNIIQTPSKIPKYYNKDRTQYIRVLFQRTFVKMVDKTTKTAKYYPISGSGSLIGYLCIEPV